jgi:L-seryl-tRNA(Ser) seleniumtransferase
MKLELEGWARARGFTVALVDGESTVGGGSLPGATLPTTLIALEGSAPAALLAELRAAGVIGRINDNRVLLDLRTVLRDDDLLRALSR